MGHALQLSRLDGTLCAIIRRLRLLQMQSQPGLLQVRSVFEPAALKGTIEALLRDGVILVATSIRAPWELNEPPMASRRTSSSFVVSVVDACDIVQLGPRHRLSEAAVGARLSR
jgi:hypothetical protein